MTPRVVHRDIQLVMYSIGEQAVKSGLGVSACRKETSSNMSMLKSQYKSISEKRTNKDHSI